MIVVSTPIKDRALPTDWYTLSFAYFQKIARQVHLLGIQETGNNIAALVNMLLINLCGVFSITPLTGGGGLQGHIFTSLFPLHNPALKHAEIFIDWCWCPPGGRWSFLDNLFVTVTSGSQTEPPAFRQNRANYSAIGTAPCSAIVFHFLSHRHWFPRKFGLTANRCPCCCATQV